LLVTTGEKNRAAELVAMILRHSATQKETRRNAKDILSELTAELPSEVVATAQERGQKQKLQDVMREIIDQT
jgi:hypothetical protein